MKNTRGRYAGPVAAAQFLQRFVNGAPWAHFDIAGAGMGAPSNEINHSWGSGFGVRPLDRLIADHYEGRRAAPRRALTAAQTPGLSTAGFDNQASERLRPKTKSNIQPEYRHENHLYQAGLRLMSV